jgi:RsiW-degrading membrane proteinase PrsW (M82 family)
VRLALLVVLFFWILGFIVAAGRPETGPIEDVVLIALIGGLFALAVPVRRIGATQRS